MNDTSTFYNPMKVVELLTPYPKDESIIETYKKFKTVLIYCKDNEKFTFIECPLKVIKYSMLLNNLSTVHKVDIEEHLSGNNIVMSGYMEVVLVLFLPFLNKINIETFLAQYINKNTFLEYLISISINNIFTITYNTAETELNRIKQLCSMDETSFWQLEHNCNINITKQFLKRDFKKSNNVVMNISLHRELFDDVDNYIFDIYAQKKFIDASSNSNNINYRVPKFTENNIHPNDITFMLKNKNISEKEKYHLITNLMASKKYCHLIINNYDILIWLHETNFIEKYYDIFVYLLQYVWLTFYMDESHKKNRITIEDRFVFDITVANLLPQTPCSNVNKLTDSAYLPLLINKHLSCIKSNFHCATYLYNPSINYGVCTLEHFKIRFNYHVSGKADCDLFHDMDWSNIAVSGSTMACCLPNFNPIMAKFMVINRFNPVHLDFIKYANNQYKNSDIDIMCTLKGNDFIDKIRDIRDTLERNIKQFMDLNEDIRLVIDTEVPIDTILVRDSINEIVEILEMKNQTTTATATIDPNDSDDEIVHCNPKKVNIHSAYYWNDINSIVHVKLLKTVNIYITKEFIKQRLIIFEEDDLEEDINDKINEVRCQLESRQYIPRLYDIVYELYVQDCSIDQYEFDDKYIDNYSVVSKKQIKLFNSCIETDKIITYYPILKYHLTSKYMKRPLEIFQIKYNDFFGTVALFHLPIVRSFYNGTTVKVLPTCISACKTLTNLDYKFFAGIKSPMTTTNKYYKNGFGGFYSDIEIAKIVQYNIENDVIIDGIKFDNVKDVKDLLYITSIPQSSRKKVPNDVIMYDNKTIYQYYPNYEPSFFNALNLHCINSEGNVNELQLNVINAGFDIIKRQNIRQHYRKINDTIVDSDDEIEIVENEFDESNNSDDEIEFSGMEEVE